MDIGSIGDNNGKVVDTGSRRMSQTDQSSQEKSSSAVSDSVQISDEARGRLAELADAARRIEIEHPELGGEEEDRLEHIKARIANGLYNNPEVKRQLADRLAQRLFEQGNTETEE